jgi:hypothetical protein
MKLQNQILMKVQKNFSVTTQHKFPWNYKTQILVKLHNTNFNETTKHRF